MRGDRTAEPGAGRPPGTPPAPGTILRGALPQLAGGAEREAAEGAAGGGGAARRPRAEEGGEQRRGAAFCGVGVMKWGWGVCSGGCPGKGFAWGRPGEWGGGGWRGAERVFPAGKAELHGKVLEVDYSVPKKLR